MLAWTLLACKHEGQPPPPPPPTDSTEELPLRQKAATLNFLGSGGDVPTHDSRLWLQFQTIIPQLPSEQALDSCQESEPEDIRPLLLDAGELTVRIDRYIPLDEGEAYLEDYPAGALIWFEASGGEQFP